MVAKAVLHIPSTDILKATGDIQLSTGQFSGCEAGVHAMAEIQVMPCAFDIDRIQQLGTITSMI